MPTYDYQCRSCGSVTEVIHAMTADGPTVCERCGGELRRVLYPAGIIFKGSGFYRTDSRSSDSSSVGGKTASSGESGTGTGSTSKASGSDGSGTASASGSSESSGPAAKGGSAGGESAA